MNDKSTNIENRKTKNKTMSIKSKTSSIGSNTSKNSVKLSETVNDENEPRARLCHLKKWQHFQGYGFNLHAERAKSGQHIGKVDINSPAESAGLKEGDRIVEVNYVNISNENHQQVVKRIRNGLTLDGTVNENEVVLLVVDNEADEHYKKLNIIVKHDSDNVLKLTTIEKVSDETKSDELETSNHNEPQATSEENTSITTAAAADAEKEVIPSQQQENKLNTSKSSSSLASSAHSINNTTNTSSNNINNNNQDSLISNSSNNLNEILSVNDELDNKLSKKTESTSSASNLSANSSENQSRSSKSNAQTPTSQKKETKSNTSTHERHQIKPEIITTKSTHLINNATVDPFRKYNFFLILIFSSYLNDADN